MTAKQRATAPRYELTCRQVLSVYTLGVAIGVAIGACVAWTTR